MKKQYLIILIKILSLYNFSLFYTNKLINSINIIPDTEMTVSNNVHVKNVSFIVYPKYSLNIQNPASFTCVVITLPATVANTTRARFASEASNNGATIPTVDIAATVADPKAILRTEATIHASKIGLIAVPVNNSSTVFPTPPSINTCLKAPPPPIINNIIPIGY